MSDTLTVLHPGIEGPGAAVKAAANAAVAAAAGSLKGLRVALFDNTKINADNLFAAIARRLEALGAGPVQMFRKRHAGDSGADKIPGMLAWQPDLVLTGLGD